jgi:hypothetical protein
VIIKACLHGTSIRKAGDLVKAFSMDSGISKSEVSRYAPTLTLKSPPGTRLLV